MKDMLHSLRIPLNSEMVACVHQYKIEVQELGERVGHAEDKMCEFTSTFNTLVDAHAV